MASILPNGKTQFIDQNGAPLAGGQVFFYAPGTSNPQATYQDQAQTIANTNPVQLDSRGQATIWGSGSYRQVVKDQSGVTIWDQVISDVTASLTAQIAAITSGMSGSGGAAMIGFAQTGAGALTRTLQDKERATLSSADYDTVQNAVNAAVTSGLLLVLEPNISIPQITVSGTLRMKAKGKVTCNYNGANGAWILIPVGADNSYLEFDEIDFNSQGTIGIEVKSNYSTVIVRNAHSITAQDYAIGNRQGVVISEGVGNVVDVTAHDLLVGTSTQGSIPRIVTTDTGSSRNLVRVNGNNCFVGWVDNGTDNTAEYVIVNQCGADGIYNLTPSVNMKCNFLQVTNSQAQPFVLEGVNPYIGLAVVDGWGFSGLQGCTNAIVDHIHVLPSPDGTPNQSVLRSRTGNTTADIRIGMITGSLTVGNVANVGALFQFLVGTVNYRITDGINLDVTYAASSAASSFVVHSAGTVAELGNVRLTFNDSAAQPASPMSWQVPSGATFKLRGWALDAKTYNYITIGGLNTPSALLPAGIEILSNGTIANPSSSTPYARIYFGTAAPTSGTWNRGDTVYHKFAAQGGPAGWRCIAAGSPGTWKIMGQTGVQKAATGSRPTASTMGVANDADWSGTWFLDSTLAANGKPIMWTGTQWVDSTGAAV